MTRRFGSGRLSNGFIPENEDINPMDGVANLADVMLVLACGLMLALIINWNVDIGTGAKQTVSLEQGQEITSALQSSGEAENPGESDQYEKLGTVYRDPVSGKLYMVTDEG